MNPGHLRRRLCGALAAAAVAPAPFALAQERVARVGMLSWQDRGDYHVTTRAGFIEGLRIEGFVVSNHYDLLPKFYQEMGKLVAEGKMKWQESVTDGLQNAPKAFLGLFKGENFGKALVKIGPDKAI